MAKKPKITDNDILKMIKSGEIKVDLETGDVRRNGRLLKGCNGRGRCEDRLGYHISVNGNRRMIVAGKLVWMAGARRILPEGFVVHHIDEDIYNNTWMNLIAVLDQDHCTKIKHVKFNPLTDVEGCQEDKQHRNGPYKNPDNIPF
jgi:hypothetical protein